MLHVKTILYERVTQKNFAKANAFIWEQCEFHYGDKRCQSVMKCLKNALKWR